MSTATNERHDQQSFYKEVMDLARTYDSFGQLHPGKYGFVSLTGVDIWRFAKSLCQTQDVCMYRRFADPPPPKAVVVLQERVKELEAEVVSLKLSLGLTAIAAVGVSASAR
jgi:hypothetical protein